ncbi:MAG: histidine phosphatase family protein [Ornithinimicrobium sp.]
MSRPRRVIVLRHGQTAHNVGGIYQGHLDTDLSDVGVQQAAAAAEILSMLPVERIVSSDLLRAAHTARVLAQATDLTVQHDSRLREIDVGSWSGLKHEEVVARYPVETTAIEQGYDARRGEHGENLHEVGVRTHAVFVDVASGLADGHTAVLVTHGVAARTLVNSVLDWSHRQAWLSVAGLLNCHWAELAEHRTGWRLVAWNAGASPLRQSGGSRPVATP